MELPCEMTSPNASRGVTFAVAIILGRRTLRIIALKALFLILA